MGSTGRIFDIDDPWLQTTITLNLLYFQLFLDTILSIEISDILS